eukprot:2491011-Rhodomonas_salina.2
MHPSSSDLAPEASATHRDRDRDRETVCVLAALYPEFVVSRLAPTVLGDHISPLVANAPLAGVPSPPPPRAPSSPSSLLALFLGALERGGEGRCVEEHDD